MARIACSVVGGVVFACAGCVENDAECTGERCLSSAEAGCRRHDGELGLERMDERRRGRPTSLESSSTVTTTDATATTTSSDLSTSGTADDTAGLPCGGSDCPALGECFEVRVWQSCTQYCEADNASCVERGCAGATVVYFGDAYACVEMRAISDSAQSCDAAFEQGGGVSFGRCCCE